MAEKAPYRTERLDDSNLKDVQFLYKKIFGKRISLENLTKKYDTSYTGIKHVTFLAYDGTKPIAFYGALPQLMNHKGETILAVHTCDSLTLPDYQRKGLHKMLALKAYDLMKEQGVRFVYAFHSENTFHSCKKLDWELGITIRGFTIKTAGLPFVKALRKFRPFIGPLNRYNRNVLLPFQIPVETFENSNSNSGLYHVYDQAFFSYKCFTNNLVIKIENVKFWLNITSRVSVGDVVFESETDLLKGIKKLKKLTSQIGLNEILFQTTPGSKIEHALSKHFTGFESWKVGFYCFDDEIDVRQLKSNFGDLDTF
ncbi:MAG: hypothetical protein ACI85F_000478 [Bacteroidia bacterium]|jgi:GNAT superfamily N-acetyltransferase